MIILGTGCIGKTTLAKKYSNCVDLESSDFQWIFTDEYSRVDSEKRKGVKIAKRQNPDWPENYINAVIREHEAGKIVLAGVFLELIDFLNSNNYEYFGVISAENSARTLAQRSIERGNKKNLQII